MCYYIFHHIQQIDAHEAALKSYRLNVVYIGIQRIKRRVIVVECNGCQYTDVINYWQQSSYHDFNVGEASAEKSLSNALFLAIV